MLQKFAQKHPLVLCLILFGIIMFGIIKPLARYVAENGGWSGFIIAMAVIFGIGFLIERR